MYEKHGIDVVYNFIKNCLKLKGKRKKTHTFKVKSEENNSVVRDCNTAINANLIKVSLFRQSKLYGKICDII